MKRQGTTLIEVLAAIFILALGLVALMTLFPLGATQMFRAIQDERASQLAANATAYFRWNWKTMCEAEMLATQNGQMMFETPSAGYGWYGSAMDDPNAGVPASFAKNAPNIFPATNQPTATNVTTRARTHLPSYPVFVDPVGWYTAGLSANQYWLAEQPPTAAQGGYIHAPIPRRTLATATTLPNVIRNFSLLDDLSFDTDGMAIVNERQGWYTCAWLLRRDNSSRRTETNLTVAVFYRRSVATLTPETSYAVTAVGPATADALTTSVTLHYTGERPAIRRGNWVLDASMGNTAAGVPPQGFYYRVTEVGEPVVGAGESTIDLQLETPLRPGPYGAKARVFVVQSSLLEVFDKGPIDMTSPPRIN